MAHFVQRRVCTALALREGGRGARNVVFVKCDAPRVFHGAEVVFGHVYLVVGSPWEGHSVALVEEVKPCTGHLEDIVGVEVARERTTAQEAQRQLGVVAIRCPAAPRAAVNDGPRAGDDRRDVA